MKNKKLNLSALKVESFVTNLKTKSANTVKGGTGADTLNALVCTGAGDQISIGDTSTD